VAVWVGVGLAFGVWVLAAQGATAATEYYAAYFLEQSLSIDNVFVFVIIFSELHIPAEHQRRVLAFGILGALVLRGAGHRRGHRADRAFRLGHVSVCGPDPVRGVADAVRRRA
jgi:hypothetical protein